MNYSMGSKWMGALVSVVVVVVIWVNFAMIQSIPFYGHPNDNPWAGLSLAYTMETKANGASAVNVMHTFHPGLPWTLLSWLSYRLAYLSTDSWEDRVLQAVENAEVYWLWVKIVSLFTVLSAVVFAFFIFRNRPYPVMVGLLCFLGALPATIMTMSAELTNETFSFLYVALFFWFLARFFSKVNVDGPINGNGFSWTVVGGMLGGLGLLTKLNFFAFFVGWIFVLLFFAGTDAYRFWNRSIKFVVAVFAAVLTSFAGYGLLFGVEALRQWIQWNTQMLMHTGRYGSGESGFLSVEKLAYAVADLAHQTYGTFIVLVGFLIVISSYEIWQRIVRKSGGSSNAWIALAIGTFGALLGMLKQYDPKSLHYGVPVAAGIAFVIMAWLDQQKPNKKVVVQLGVVGFLLLVTNIMQARKVMKVDQEYLDSVRVDIKEIEALPISSGQQRVWVYLSPSKHSYIPLAMQASGSAAVEKILADYLMRDSVPHVSRNSSSWKYLMFPRRWFPTEQDVRNRYRESYDISYSDFKLASTDIVRALPNFYVVELAGQRHHSR